MSLSRQNTSRLSTLLTVVAAGALWLGVGLSTAQAQPYPTTYGEDPVPPTRKSAKPNPFTKCENGFLQLPYGEDPIPCETLKQRFHAWQDARNVGGMPASTSRAPAKSATSSARKPDSAARSRRTAQPSSRRVH